MTPNIGIHGLLKSQALGGVKGVPTPACLLPSMRKSTQSVYRYSAIYSHLEYLVCGVNKLPSPIFPYNY